MGCLVYLGTHLPQWLGRLNVPLFVSRRRLAGRRTLPRARARWALDSGGFSELQMYGEWRTSPEQYVEEVRRFRCKIGLMDWAAIQDWMCEPQVINGLVCRRKSRKKPAIDLAEWKRWARRVARQGHAGVSATLARAKRLERDGNEVEVLFHGTGLSVEEHQRRTIKSYQTLKALAPEVEWTPVLQGDFLRGPVDHARHIELYKTAGIDLRSFPVVGVGSVCRLKNTTAAEQFFCALKALGINGHGFGLKGAALVRVAHLLVSSDSLAWSYDGRRSPPLPGCVGHKNCANCERYALKWLDNLLAQIPRDGQVDSQLSLFPEVTRCAA